MLSAAPAMSRSGVQTGPGGLHDDDAPTAGPPCRCLRLAAACLSICSVHALFQPAMLASSRLSACGIQAAMVVLSWELLSANAASYRSLQTHCELARPMLATRPPFPLAPPLNPPSILLMSASRGLPVHLGVVVDDDAVLHVRLGGGHAELDQRDLGSLNPGRASRCLLGIDSLRSGSCGSLRS